LAGSGKEATVVSTKLAEIELRHIVDSLDRVLANLKGTDAELNVAQLQAMAKSVLALVSTSMKREPK
jgi:hypothetical protein